MGVSALVLGAVVWWAVHQPAPTLPSSREDLLALALAVVPDGVCATLRAERWRTLLHDVDARPRAATPTGSCSWTTWATTAARARRRSRARRAGADLRARIVALLPTLDDEPRQEIEFVLRTSS